MRVIIRDQASDASDYVANYVVERIKQFNPTPERPFVLGLPTGSSPLNVYKALVKQYKAGNVSFENVVTFNMDEYIGLPRDHPESYHTFMWTHLFSHINIHPKNAHILDGNAPSPAAECARYEALMRRVGGVDLFLAGVGSDGHIAFNEPGSSLASRTRVKTLTYDTVLANSRFFGGDTDKVPRLALTVGVGTLLEAREVVAIVMGRGKAVAMQKCVEGAVSHMWTLSCLQLHPNSMIVCDDESTMELQVKTVRYFKSIESPNLKPLHPHPPTLPQETLPPPSEEYTPQPPVPTTALNGNGPSPSPILQPLPISSHLRVPDGVSDRSVSPDGDLVPDSMSSHLRIPDGAAPRTVSPDVDLVPDRMASRIPGGGFAGRLSPQPGGVKA